MDKATNLPSIHDMFPDHLLGLATPSSSRTPYNLVRSNHHQRVVYNDSTPLSALPHPLVHNPSPQRTSKSPSTYSSEEEQDDDSINDRKHLCNLCGKKFNRPSSLRIHMNTHTGATPFSCPFPDCGRTFNVNSNMRRHYRNHRSTHPLSAHSTHHANSLRSSIDTEQVVDAACLVGPGRIPGASFNIDCNYFGDPARRHQPAQIQRLSGPGAFQPSIQMPPSQLHRGTQQCLSLEIEDPYTRQHGY